MPTQVAQHTPLADALTEAIQAKVIEVGLAQSNDASALAEYITLTLVNGKNQEDIVTELSTELLGLPANDPIVITLVAWMFEQVEVLNVQLNGAAQPSQVAEEPNLNAQDASATVEMDTDMNAGDASELNAYVFLSGPASLALPLPPFLDSRDREHR